MPNTLGIRTNALCNMKCPHWSICPMKDLALAKKTKGSPKCALIDKPQHILDSFENIFLKPLDEGIISELKHYMMLLSMKAGRPTSDISDIKEAVDACIKIYKYTCVEQKKLVGNNNITFNVKVINDKPIRKMREITFDALDDPNSVFTNEEFCEDILKKD